LFVLTGKVVKKFTGIIVERHRSAGNTDLRVFPVFAVPVAAHAMLAPFRFKGVIESKFEERIFVRVGHQINISALAAIAAAGTALRDEFLPSKGNAAVPAVSGANSDSGFIDKHERRNANGIESAQWGGFDARIQNLQAGSFDRLDADEAAGVAFVFECDDAGDFCKEGIVASDAHIHAWFEFCSALTNENGSTGDQLTTEAFHTQPLGMTVAAIS
jgi:hypothetical protein